MEYYSLHNGIEDIGQGGFPQIQDFRLSKGRSVDDPDFVWKLRDDRFPEFVPHFGTLILEKNAELTDFISAAMISVGFVCNGKVRSVLNSYNLGKTQFYDLVIRHKSTRYYDYKLMHCINNYLDEIDFENSVFHKLRISGNKRIGQRCELKNFTEFDELKRKLSQNKYGDWDTLRPVNIKFKNKFRPVHDIFLIWGVTYQTYISQRLRKAFDESNITGVMYDFDYDHLNFES